MSIPEDLAGQLEKLLGCETRHQGHACVIHEILDNGRTLILISVQQENIQGDQFGNPRRRVPLSFSVPIIDEDGRSPHPEYLALELPVKW
ncbi:MAG TPA: hypothetical protein ENI64_01260 [Gammaproteobacteria bacterium]|nr:hypothetical protein [Gammaproteobacteria bacterium]